MIKLKTSFRAESELTRADFGLLIFIGYILIILQSSLLVTLAGLRGYGPEPALAVVMYGALRTDELSRGLFLALVLGLVRDAVGGGFFGLYPATFMAVAGIIYLLRRHCDFGGLRQLGPVVFIFALGSGIIVTGPLLSLTGRALSTQVASPHGPGVAFLISCLVTGLLAWPIFALLNSVFKRRRARDS